MSFVTLPFMALVRRELITLLRSKKTFLMLFLFVLAATLIAAGFWPKDRWDPTVAAKVSADLLGGLSAVFVCSYMLFIPGLAAVTLTLERERETNDLLYTTLIRPSGIILAKLVNILGFYSLLLISVMPVLAVVFFLVGVDWVQISVTFGLLFAGAFSCAAAGILCSARCRRSIAALIFSYVAMLALMGFFTFLVLVLTEAFFPGTQITGRQVEAIMSVSSPAAAAMLAQVGFSPQPHALYTIALQCAAAVVCLVFAQRAYRRPHEPRVPRYTAVIDDAESLRQRRARFPYYLIDPLRRKKPIEDRRNPMLVRELRWGVSGRLTMMVRVFYVCLVISVFSAIAFAFVVVPSFRTSRQIVWLPFFHIVLMAVVAPALLVHALTREQEQSQLDLLRISLLAPRQIVLGKTAAALCSLAPVMIPSLLGGIAVIAFEGFFGRYARTELQILLVGYGSFAACTMLSAGLSLIACAYARRLVPSLILSYFLTLMAYGGLACSVALAGHWIESSLLRSRGFHQFVAFLSPLTALVVSVQGGIRFPGSSWGYRRVDFGAVYWACNMLVFGGLGVRLIFAAISVFARRHTRG